MAKNDPAPSVPRLRLRPRSCGHCGGDAYLDPRSDDGWLCLQCARAIPGAVRSRNEGPPAR